MFEIGNGQLLSLILNEYTTARVSFDKNNIPLEIKSVEVQLRDSTGAAIPIIFHNPPRPNYPDKGKVEFSFDPVSTIKSPGIYTIEVKAACEDPTTGSTIILSKEQNIEFSTRSIAQWYIDELRIALGDNAFLTGIIPRRFFVRDPSEVMWTDEELYSYITMTVREINSFTPPTMIFNLNHLVPYAHFVIFGGMIRALMAAGLIEVYNWYDTNAPVRVMVYKGDKFKDFSNWIQQSYIQPVQEWKRSLALYTAFPKVAVLTRLPFRVIKPLSMMYGYHNFFSG